MHNSSNTELELNVIASSILENFRKIFFFNVFVVFIAIVYSLSLKNIYQSEIKLILKQEIQSPTSGINMAIPINIGSSSGYEINYIRSVLSSRDFFKILYQDDNFIALTDGLDNYDKKTKSIVYDNKKIDLDGNWRTIDGISQKPSFEKSYKNSKSYFSSSVDQSSGIVNLNFDHISPYYSKELLEKIYINLNEYLKELKLYEIDMKIKFLNKSYSEANVQDIKTNISKLLENEIEKKAILLSSENIYFDLIDSSSKGLRVAPKRSLIVLLISTISFISTILYFLLRKMYENSQ